MRFQPVTRQTIHTTPQWNLLPEEQREAVAVVSRVLPFRVNRYIMDELIDWHRIPDDPIFRLTFPHRDMLGATEYEALRQLLATGVGEQAIEAAVRKIRMRMNPHPAGQITHNIPLLDGVRLSGMQHKYRETVLFFPAAGQSCHSYCTFCFRWPQFVGMDELRFAARQTSDLVEYLRRHRDVSDVLITGGDPLVMNTRLLASYITPLLAPELEHIDTIRIGTKSVAYWPQRFVSDVDASDLLKLFEQVVASGKNLALMAHYSHPAELRTLIAQQAARRIVATGAVLRMQAPLIRHVNDCADDWVGLWRAGVRLGAVPYYMFVERDTGPADYFALPLSRAYTVFQQAYRQVSGLARTVRGPTMSTHRGKVLIDGIVSMGGEKLFALQYLQARTADQVRQPFYARFDPVATWFEQLQPAFASDAGFFQASRPVREVSHA
nr:lysine 2,3-aminomutase [uncultured Duganella sp.]